jgi:hypothetical protein
MLYALKLQADYEPKSNAAVEKLDELLSYCMDSIMGKATELYTQSKKSVLDKMFSKMRSEHSADQQYANAVFFGHTFIDDAKRAEGEVDIAMRRYGIRGYSKQDYLANLFSKAKTEKKMIIERVWPYAEKAGKTKLSLTYVF